MLQHHAPIQPGSWLKFYLFLFLAFGVWQPGVQPAQAATWTICKNGSCPFATIQAAIDDEQVSEGDTLQFITSRETYSEMIVIDKSLTLVGDATIINAQGGGTAVTITNNATVTMQNMTIQNGSEGGIQLVNGDLTLTNVTISDNDAAQGGGLHIASGSSAQLNQVTIRQNTAVSGGAIYNDGTVVANNLTLSLNFATNGAGIYNSSNGTVLLDNQTSIRQNGTTETLTTQTGGGIFNAGSLTLQNLDITNNKAQNGAGIYNVGWQPGNE